MSFLGSIGKAVGNLVGGLFGGGDSSRNVGVVIPPTTQEAYNIVKGLEGQVGDIASSQYNIMKPYLDEALFTFRNFPNTINQLYSDTEGTIGNRYTSLFNNIQSQMNNQWSKSALGLSALGMYNTPATQLTQSDIVNQLYGKIAEQETQALNQLDINKMGNLIDYYSKAPQLLSSFGETFASVDPTINKYNLQLQLAGVLNGLNTALYPKTSPLAQVGKMLGNAILQSKELPSFSGIMNSISSIFGGGGSSSGFLPDFSGELGSALNGVFDTAGADFFANAGADIFADAGADIFADAGADIFADALAFL
jgi:hypothetical protein